MARRRIDHIVVKKLVISGLRAGLSLVEASTAAGVHIATTYRWRKADSRFQLAVDNAILNYSLRNPPPEPEEHWLVRWRNECPLCRAKLVVRTTRAKARFWRCGLWPRCRWASWRPRHPRNCPNCKGPRYWSHSRKTVVCEPCGMRTKPPKQRGQHRR